MKHTVTFDFGCGDTVYRIDDGEVVPFEIVLVKYSQTEDEDVICYQSCGDNALNDIKRSYGEIGLRDFLKKNSFRDYEIGRTVFTTKAEAEKKVQKCPLRT